MGSVLDTMECPRCKGEATTDFYYKTGEEYVFCPSCGYRRECTYLRDENGNLVTKDGTDNYEFKNLFWTEKEVQPLACYGIKFKESIATQMGCLETTEKIEEFRAEVESRKDELELAYISSYDTESETTTLEKLIDLTTPS